MNLMNERISKMIETSPAYSTRMGSAFISDSREILRQMPDQSVNLVITSPPFALLRKKEYGNEEQETYLDWLASFASIIYDKLTPDGSFVLDLGGAYERGLPSRSLYNFRVAIKLVDEIGFTLAEDFYWYNPSKLPSPIEWVNKRKIRAKDSVNTVWWFSKSPWCKSDVSQVLVEYSERMKTLIKNPEKFYTPAKRPSGHDISSNFGKDNGGAIPSNLLQIANSESDGNYTRACKQIGVRQHPARFPARLPEFFIRMLTNKGDLVVDIFAGSNTTGMVAEREQRNWISIDSDADYVATSSFRFLKQEISTNELKRLFDEIKSGSSVDVGTFSLTLV